MNVVASLAKGCEVLRSTVSGIRIVNVRDGQHDHHHPVCRSAMLQIKRGFVVSGLLQRVLSKGNKVAF